MSNHHLRLTICHRYIISFTFLLFNNTLKDQTFLIHLIRDCRNRSPVPPSNIYTLVEQCIKDGLVLLIAQVRDAVSLCEPSLHLSTTGALIPLHSNITTSHWLHQLNSCAYQPFMPCFVSIWALPSPATPQITKKVPKYCFLFWKSGDSRMKHADEGGGGL